MKLPAVEKYCIPKIPNEFSKVCSGTMYLNYHEDPVDSLGQDRLLDFAFTNQSALGLGMRLRDLGGWFIAPILCI